MADEFENVGCNFGTGRERKERGRGGGADAAARSANDDAAAAGAILLLLLRWGKCMCRPEEGKGTEMVVHG